MAVIQVSAALRETSTRSRVWCEVVTKLDAHRLTNHRFRCVKLSWSRSVIWPEDPF